MADINDIKYRVSNKVDACEFVEVCEITIEELMEAFPDKMVEYMEELGVEDLSEDDEE